MTEKKKVSPAEEWIAKQPGVGQGMLDSLRTLFATTSPIAVVFDTSSANPRAIGQMQRNKERMRVVLNPKAFADIAARGANVAREAPLTLVHEATAHGALGYGSSPENERDADLLGEAWLNLTGRDSERPIQGAAGMRAYVVMRDLLERLKGLGS